MYLLENNCTDPAWNLALDEYLLTRFPGEVLTLWRNGPSVIIGKNQNALEEIDLDFVRVHQIPVVRRLTGGGAVFHDLGNINYTLVQPCGAGDFNNYAKFTKPIVDFLATLGAWLLLVYMGLISAVAYTVWGILLQHNPVSRVTIFNFMTPLFGVLLSAVFLGEWQQAFSPRTLIALVLVCLGIYVVNRMPRQKEQTKTA